MTDEISNPNAQGPQTGADGQAQTVTPAPQQAGSLVPEGVQKRIDELTFQKHEAERRFQESQQMNQQLLMSMTQGQIHQQAPVQQAPQVEIDPEQRKVMEAYMAPLLAQHQRQLAQMAFQSGQAQLQAALQGQHPAVAKRTQEIWQDAVSKRAHENGFTPAQALTWAKGEMVDLLVQEAGKNQQVQQGRQWNAQPQAITTQSLSAPQNGSQQTQAPDLDDDPEAASAFYAQRLAGKNF